MRRPFIEAGPLLAAHGRSAGTRPKPQTPWSRLMSQSIDYAYLNRIDAVAKPMVVASLDRLAQHLDTLRRGQAILLEEVEDIHQRRRMASGAGPDAPHGLRDRGVQIFTMLLDGTRDRSLGFAWLRGGGREELQAALTRVGLRNGFDPRLPMVA